MPISAAPSAQALPHGYAAVIAGGGIAGLWVLRRLLAAGVPAILIDDTGIGGVQTIASQGMIHGGQKYHLGGAAHGAAATAADMPRRWDACLAGEGDIDLRGVRVLSDYQVMWTAGGMAADLALYAASKTMTGGTHKMDADSCPAVLRAHGVTHVYRLDEKVLDTASLAHVLAAPASDRIFKARLETSADGLMAVSADGHRVPLGNAVLIALAGAGNADIVRGLGAHGVRTQVRPLRQVMISGVPYALYGHGVAAATKPRVTVTAHSSDADDTYVWYLGGALAEKATAMNDADAIEYARREMKAMFPAIDWASYPFACWYGERAEPFDENGAMGAGPQLIACGENAYVGWPMKLTFAPQLGDMAVACFAGKDLPPLQDMPDLPSLPLASPPWLNAAWRV